MRKPSTIKGYAPEDPPIPQTDKELAAEYEAQPPTFFDNISRLGREWTRRPTRILGHRLGIALLFAGMRFLRPDQARAADEYVVGQPIHLKRLHQLPPDAAAPIGTEQLWGMTHSYGMSDQPNTSHKEADPDLYKLGVHAPRVSREEGPGDFYEVDAAQMRIEFGGESFLVEDLQAHEKSWRDSGPRRVRSPRRQAFKADLFATNHSYLAGSSPNKERAAAFRLFIAKEVADYIAGTQLPEEMSAAAADKIRAERKAAFESGSVTVAMAAIQHIFDTHFHYDKDVEENLRFTPQGRPEAINPNKDMRSADGSSVDQILMDEKPGVCRHAAEAYAMVFEEVKREHPQLFQNTDVMPMANAFQGHEYLIVLQDRENDLAVTTYDPLNPTSAHANPASEVMKTQYFRGAITGKDFFDMTAQFFALGGKEHPGDVYAFLDLALNAINKPQGPVTQEAARTAYGVIVERMRAQIQQRYEASRLLTGEAKDAELMAISRLTLGLGPYSDTYKEMTKQSH